MKVLIACEESQRVCIAFRERGHEAYSCDIQECSGGHPEWHIQGDVLSIINGNCEFETADGQRHRIDGKWDLLIAHPPCTYLTNASACRMYHKHKDGKSYLDEERVKAMIVSRDLFMAFVHADCKRIAIENPTPMKIACLPKCTQVIQPYEYGHPYSKRTCLWLKGLRNLIPTDVVEPTMGSWVNGCACAYKIKGKENIFDKSTAKERSKTFPGIAKAMADQWGR